jgi:hypothetical protein
LDLGVVVDLEVVALEAKVLFCPAASCTPMGVRGAPIKPTQSVLEALEEALQAAPLQMQAVMQLHFQPQPPLLLDPAALALVAMPASVVLEVTPECLELAAAGLAQVVVS